MKKLVFTLSFVLLAGWLQAQVIEVTGMGVYSEQVTTLYFSDIDNIDKIVVEAIFKQHESGPAIDPVTFTNFEGPVTVDPQFDIEDYNSTGDPSEGEVAFFMHTFLQVDDSGITLDQGEDYAEGGSIHSFIAYIYRNIDDADYNSVTDPGMQHVFFYRNNETTDPCDSDYPQSTKPPDGAYEVTIPIPTSTEERDITVTVPVSELDATARNGFIEVSVGSITLLDEFDEFNFGNSLYINPLILYNVPGEAEEIVIRIWSPCDEDYYTQGVGFGGGDSFIISPIVVDVPNIPPPPPPQDEYCTLTQGFYGNAGGMFNNWTTYELLSMLLEEPLVIGKAGDDYYSFTIETPECILLRLPGGGSSKALTEDDNEECSSNGYKTHKDGRIKNNLLAQTITLGLNLRLDQNLGDLMLSDLFFYNYNGFDETTIQELYNMANDVLGGDGSYSYNLGSIASALGAINDYFDECQPFSPENKSSNSVNLDYTESGLNMFPNPVSNFSTIEFTSLQSDYTSIELYDLMGNRVQTAFSGFTTKGETYSFGLDGNHLNAGIYLLVLRNGNVLERIKISVQ